MWALFALARPHTTIRFAVRSAEARGDLGWEALQGAPLVGGGASEPILTCRAIRRASQRPEEKWLRRK
ncbi:hypothetical protein B484DRAFT_422999 [Ochromonadaceae sp. CCMP2298]|nr:hypothetical protein B484DRAFT_422999 [Ochromonadaceae sp. CCMP2298]